MSSSGLEWDFFDCELEGSMMGPSLGSPLSGVEEGLISPSPAAAAAGYNWLAQTLATWSVASSSSCSSSSYLGSSSWPKEERHREEQEAQLLEEKEEEKRRQQWRRRKAGRGPAGRSERVEEEEEEVRGHRDPCWL